MMSLGIIFITGALLIYTVVIWSERISKKLSLWMIVFFSLAFTCDLIGTGTMFFIAEEKFSASIHSYAGYIALAIMLLHLIWALFSYKRESWAKYFTKYSIFAWFIWLVAFFSGMPKR